MENIEVIEGLAATFCTLCLGELCVESDGFCAGFQSFLESIGTVFTPYFFPTIGFKSFFEIS